MYKNQNCLVTYFDIWFNKKLNKKPLGALKGKGKSQSTPNFNLCSNKKTFFKGRIIIYWEGRDNLPQNS